MEPRARPAWRLIALGAIVAAGMAAAKWLGIADLLGPGGLGRARDWVEALGALGPLAFIGVYVVGVVAFVPSLPMSVLAGLLFGPIAGTAYASVAATAGACLAFAIARYTARDLVRHWVARSPALARLDQAAVHHGFRLVMVTRLVPIFPFNVQNYAYGITGIGFLAYAITSWICMLPATVVFTVAGGSLVDGRWTFAGAAPWLGLAALLLVALVLLARRLSQRSPVLDELLRPAPGSAPRTDRRRGC
jgi:uncharacterized membrane protein YdjX (TVP38/TMEM64 family)